MLSVVTFVWGTSYGAPHVDALFRMVLRHYGPHRFICVTNERVDLDPRIEVVPDREDFAEVASPAGPRMPSCYRRLRLFAPDAAETFGERFVCLDLDLVILDDVRPLWDRPEDCVLYRDPLFPSQANGSMFLLRAGSRPDVWTMFDPADSPEDARMEGLRGSDQAWISYCLPNEPRWGPEDGVYSYKLHVKDRRLPANARLVIFHGKPKPWEVQCHWIAAAMR